MNILIRVASIGKDYQSLCQRPTHSVEGDSPKTIVMSGIVMPVQRLATTEQPMTMRSFTVA